MISAAEAEYRCPVVISQLPTKGQPGERMLPIISVTF